MRSYLTLDSHLLGEGAFRVRIRLQITQYFFSCLQI